MNKRILIIDPTPLNVKLFSELITNKIKGAEIAHANSFEELEKSSISSLLFDFIIVEPNVREMEPKELPETLKKIKELKDRVLIVTASGISPQVEFWKTQGFEEKKGNFMIMPINVDNFIAVVKNRLGIK